MSRTRDGLKAALGNSVRATGTGLSVEVAITDAELVTAKAKLFGGPTLTRYALDALTEIELVPNPTANRLQVHFGSSSLMLLYGPEAQDDFSVIIGLLKQRLPQR